VDTGYRIDPGRAAALPRSGKRSLWVSGGASGRSLEALEQRGVRVHTRVFAGQTDSVIVVTELIPQRAEDPAVEDEGNQTGKLARDMQDGASNLVDGLGSALFGSDDDETEPAEE
jgi:hypothetical protein